MLHPFHTKTDTARRMVAFSIIMGGWLQFLLLQLVHPGNLAVMTTFAIGLLVLGIGFCLVTWLIKGDKYPESAIRTGVTTVAWASLVAGTLAVFALPFRWGILALIIASYPLLYEWVRRVTTLSGARRRMFLIAWLGGFFVVGILALAARWIGTQWALVGGLAIANLTYYRMPTVTPNKRATSSIQVPTKMLALAFGIFFSLGLGGSSIVDIRLRNLRVLPTSLLSGFIWMAAFIVATTALPLLFHKKPRWLVYSGCSILVAALLVRLQNVALVSATGLVILVLTGGLILVLWWLSVLFGLLRHGAAVLAIGLATATLATGLACTLALLLPGIVEQRWVMALVVMGMVLLLPVVTLRSTFAGTAPRTSGSAALRGVESFYLEAKLTQQERKIVDLLLAGSNNQDILGHLYISINTLKTHLRNIYRKTDTSNRRELIGVIEQYHAYNTGE